MKRSMWIALAILPILAAFITLAVVSPGGTYHADCEYYLRVDGRIVDGATGAPIAQATVLAIPGHWAVSEPDTVEWIRSEFQEAQAAQRRAPPDGEGPHPLLLPWGGGAVTSPAGAFRMILVVPWSYNSVEGSIHGEIRPPAREGVAVIRIEIEGREPITLDAPHGTWTEHPGKDGLWATHDLGVVAVPPAP